MSASSRFLKLHKGICQAGLRDRRVFCPQAAGAPGLAVGVLGLTAALLLGLLPVDAHAELVLVAEGVDRAPIILTEGDPASSANRQAADDLAEYIEKVSGARPAVLTALPDPFPETAIWVGLHPHLETLFPEVDVAFAQREEILIVANAHHLAMVGRDRFRDAHQVEFGTANAVYTFIQDHLDVRWFWPGELGEDVIPRQTLTFAPFVHRFAPPFWARQIYRDSLTDRRLGAWRRFHRILNDSFEMHAGTHAFTSWRERFLETHPEYFALQPDGTRGTHPPPPSRNQKLCDSNPDVWAQWLADAEATLDARPTKTALRAAPNDGSLSGICICENCLAWDHPEGPRYRYRWAGVSQEYVATTDRNITFWNQLARLLKARFPDRDDLYVHGGAYGPYKSPPVEAVPDANIVFTYVGHFPITNAEHREREQAEWQAWSRVTTNLFFRPNLFWYSGGAFGMPGVSLRNTLEDFRFLAEHHCRGLVIDTTPQHWAAQGPQYYLMARMAWDPYLDGEAVMAEYYQRAFGPAASAVERYFALMEQAHERVVNHPGWRASSGLAFGGTLYGMLPTVYDAALLAAADSLLGEAEARVVDAPQRHGQRVAMIRAGLEYAETLLALLGVMARVNESDGKDREAVRRAITLSAQREALANRHDGLVVNKTRHLLGRMAPFIGPPTDAHLHAAGLADEH